MIRCLSCGVAWLDDVYRYGCGEVLGLGLGEVWCVDNLYEQMRAQRGYDCLDEYVLEDVLQMKGEGFDELNNLVAECASRTNGILCHSQIEAGTASAFKAYVACLHQLYLMGVAVQLKRMGYHMELM